MATLVVSGRVPRMLQKGPTLTPDMVKARLMKTAGKTFPAMSIAVEPSTGAIYTSFYDAFTRGAGYLDIAAAITNTDRDPGSAALSRALFHPRANKVVLVQECQH